VPSSISTVLAKSSLPAAAFLAEVAGDLDLVPYCRDLGLEEAWVVIVVVVVVVVRGGGNAGDGGAMVSHSHT